MVETGRFPLSDTGGAHNPFQPNRFGVLRRHMADVVRSPQEKPPSIANGRGRGPRFLVPVEIGDMGNTCSGT